ncbi:MULTISPECIES: DUF3533 domain-containing protein [unclassified Streptomyces]|uniref:DUF3533 domain-containing protein n=1 Tax=unclassified Streptomyces TaxID=2593676 RepID=UPI00381F17D7
MADGTEGEGGGAGGDGPASAGRWVRARDVLGNGAVWVFPTVLLTLVVLVLALAYSGGIADPRGSLHRLPIALVDRDTGDLGRRFVQGIATAPDPKERVSWRIMTPAQARDAFDSGRLYGAIEVPEGFTDALTSIVAPTPAGSPKAAQPHVVLLTNPGAGSLASSLAIGIEQQALRTASLRIGADLAAQARRAGTTPTTAQSMLLADPITYTTTPGHALAPRTGLGLTAFYVTLLVVMAGFLGANIISGAVDSGLGYAPTELGPKRLSRAPLLISRTQTLVAKMVMSAVLAVVTSSVIVLATAVIIRLDLPHLFQLWVFTVCASAVVGVSTQAIIAVFGGLGQIVAMIVFIALAIPSAGATVPLEAVPGFYRVLAEFEPMRQISDGVRAIVYFDAHADAGLQRAWSMMAVGLAAALVLGFGITRWYDHRGFHRIHPDEVAGGGSPTGSSPGSSTGSA